MSSARTSRPLTRAAKPLEAIGQLGGHVKAGIEIPLGRRTGKPMALVSALPLADDSDLMVLTFLDRSDPVETFDNQPHEGDNAVFIVPKEQVKLSIVKGVCPGTGGGKRSILALTLMNQWILMLIRRAWMLMPLMPGLI